MTLQQAIEYVANQPASDEGQAALDAMERAQSALDRIRQHADELLYRDLSSHDKLLARFIRDDANEQLAK